MLRLEMKNLNMNDINREVAQILYHLGKLRNMNIFQVKKYYRLIKKE